ncbi:AbiH family protein [Secundilactobacillus paracollinoides]
MNVQKLLIIGNGFDLQCGLPSTFKDFIDNSVTKQKRKKNSSARLLI